MRKNIVKNLTALFTGEVVARMCHFVAVIYIARIFGAAGFGAINFSLAIIAYFMMVTNLGLGEIGVREVSRSKDIKDVAETIISMRLGIAVISFAVILLIALVGNKTTETMYLVIAYGLTIFPYAMSLEWVFRGVEKMKYNAYGRTINAVLYLAMVLLLVRGIQDILKVAFITLAADLIACAFYYGSYSRKFGGIKLHLDLKRWLAMGKISSQLFVSSALLVVYINFGTIALGFLKDEKAVGIYGAAAKLVFFVYALSDLFVAATFPVMARLYHESREKLGEFMKYSLKVTALFGIPVAVGGTMLGPKIIRLVYGTSYVQSGPIFQILSWFAAINLTSFVLSYSLVACDRQHIYLKVMAGGALFNIAFNLLVVPYAGYYASALALVLTEVATLLWSYLIVKDLIKLPSLGSYTRLIAAAMVMVAALFALRKFDIAILMVVAVIAYFGAVFAFGGIKKSEIARIKEAFI